MTVKKPIKRKPTAKGKVKTKSGYKRPPGQPTKLTKEYADIICKRIGDGESLNAVCKDLEKVCRTTVYNWLADAENKEFLNQYTQARERQAESFIDACVDIADENENDKIKVIGKDGQEYEKVNHDHINRSRLRVDTRIKIAEKLAPKKYTPQKDLNITGDDELIKALLSGRGRVKGDN